MTNSPAAESPDVAAVITQLQQELADGKIELPLLPNVAAEVLSSSLDDQSDAARLAELIQQDQGLATHVIRIVNSPAFRGAIEIVALQQAIARLGMERIREIALSASLKGSLFKKGAYQQITDESWQLALAAGLWSKEAARASRRNVEIAYLCGLLHNIGTPMLLNRLGELVPSMPRRDVDVLLETLTPEAGARLAREWKLPGAVLASIEYLHRFAEAGDDQDVVAVTECGVALAQWMCKKGLLVSEVMQLPATQHLNLYPEDVELLLDKQEQIKISMESMG
ncbi:MAG: HDOD domain-containing protein [Gammaproteobacteria bacterium]|nr:HDOD domain-containing protein [Gammaproteobacteria bacterium]